ncbi:MAG: metallophosphoesterase [Bacteroides sp.]|nr:metallophosphoesterase [Bacteroides sp.]
MKQILPFIFMLLFLGILVGANIYLSRRFAWYFDIGHTWPLNLGFALLVLIMVLGVAVFTNATGMVGHLIYITGAVLMGLLLYLLLSVLVVDLASLVIKVAPRYFGFAVLFLTLSVSAFGILNAFNIKTREIEVEIPGLKQELRAMHLTDIHLGHFRGPVFLQKLVDKTNAQDVDMVLITGDLYDGKIRFCDACLDPLQALNAPVYFVEGNHDGYSGVERVKSGLRKVGVNVLSNQMILQGEIQIIGLNHMSADEKDVNMHANGHKATISSILPGIPTDPEKPIVLLHHSPEGIEYAAQKGVDLYLSGHTHGGQLFPVNYIGELIFRFNKGLHDFKGTKIYVGEGAGTFGPPMRVGTHSTVTVINLKPVKQ